MYGKYDIPLKIAKEDLFISMEKAGKHSYYYKRSCGDTTLEKKIILSKGALHIQPVEPLNTPKVLTSHLLVELESSLLIEPKGLKKNYITFPIDLAIIVELRGSFKVIDTMSYKKPKFTLYGEPKIGHICKYWKSPVYETIPESDGYQSGIIEVGILNKSNDWIEISQMVFNAYGMKLFFNNQLVYMKAKMRIGEDKIAQTVFQDEPLYEGMHCSIETFTTKMMSVTGKHYMMEYGL